MKIQSACTALCAAAGLIAGTGWAQQQPSQTIESAGMHNQALMKAQAQEFFPASKIVGKTAEDLAGQKLGSIKEVVFNKQGEVLALVDVGKDRWAAVPGQLVNMESARSERNVVLNTTSQALKSAPTVGKDLWGALNNVNFTQAIYAYYHVQTPMQAGAASSPGGAVQGQGSSEPQQQQLK